jgi:hypothetical protein
LLEAPQDDKAIGRVAGEVGELCRRFPVYRAAKPAGARRVAV